MRYARVAAIEEAYAKAAISQTLSPHDHMYNTGADWYFTVGADGMRVVFRALATSAMAEPKRILDLPCGHGRVARHLRAAFPRAEITFADIETDGADFCAATFGGTALHSYGAMIGDGEWQRILAGCDATGWGYAPYPETPDYGVSLCQAGTVLAMASRIEGIRILGYNERAWAGNHDVLMLEARDRMEPWP